MKKLMRLFKTEDGQSLVEYALIIALVSVALIIGLGALSTEVGNTFTDIVNAL